jgi:hypothetical protein
MEYVKGYFTVERNIVGLTLHEIEAKLGFRPGRLTSGARVLVLQRQPLVGEFVFAGSSRYPNAEGLVGVEHRQNAASTAVPHAWLGQRLLKVAPNLLHTASESYPPATSPVEQWELLVPLPAGEVCRLGPHQAYWPRR